MVLQALTGNGTSKDSYLICDTRYLLRRFYLCLPSFQAVLALCYSPFVGQIGTMGYDSAFETRVLWTVATFLKRLPKFGDGPGILWFARSMHSLKTTRRSFIESRGQETEDFYFLVRALHWTKLKWKIIVTGGFLDGFTVKKRTSIADYLEMKVLNW